VPTSVAHLSPRERFMRDTQREQTRRLALAGAILDVAAIAGALVFGGPTWVLVIFYVGLASAFIVNCSMLYLTRSLGTYGARAEVIFHTETPIIVGATCLYVGMYSPMLALAIFKSGANF